jgi:translocation protein SEC66
MANNNLLRKRLEELQSEASSEKEWWNKKKASIQSEFMKQLDEDAKGSSTAVSKVSDDDAVLVDAGVPGVQQGGGKKKKGKK